MGRILALAKGIREESDYGDYVVFTKEEAQSQLENARQFVQKAEEVIKSAK